MEVEQQMERLNAARTKVQEHAAEGSRLEGELASAEKRLGELEAQSKEQLDCPLGGLNDLIAEFKGIADKGLSQAEVVLGMSGGISGQEPEDEEPVLDEDEDPDAPLV